MLSTFGMPVPSCVLCQHRIDTPATAVNAYSACKISAGKPCSLCAEYTQLEAQIEETRTHLEVQLIKQRELRTKINQWHDPVTRRAPREIAVIIFQFAVSDLKDDLTDDSKPLRSRKLSTTPLTLGAVCGSWRDIVWASPQFWTFVSVHIRGAHVSSARFDIAREWLSRSDDLPLSIHIRIENRHINQRNSIQEFRSFIDLFNVHSNRWEDLRVFCPSWLMEYFRGNAIGAPILRHLTFFPTNFVDFHGRMEHMYAFHLQGIMPRPQCVQIRSCSNLKFMDIDWTMVTKLTTDSCMNLEYHNLLTRIPNLEHWTLLHVGNDVNSSTSLKPMLYHKLRYLHITHPEGPIWAQPTVIHFLNSLILPALKTLSLDTKRTQLLSESIISLVERSSCPLTTLSLRDATNHCNMLVDVLRRIPSIEELEFVPQSGAEGQGIQAILDLLARKTPHSNVLEGDHPRPDLLPNLRELKFSISTPHKIPWYIVPDMFGPLSSPNRRRFFTRLTIRRGPMRPDEDDFVDEEIVLDKMISKLTAQRLLEVVDAGIEINLPARLDRSKLVDLLERSEIFSTAVLPNKV